MRSPGMMLTQAPRETFVRDQSVERQMALSKLFPPKRSEYCIGMNQASYGCVEGKSENLRDLHKNIH